MEEELFEKIKLMEKKEKQIFLDELIYKLKQQYCKPNFIKSKL